MVSSTINTLKHGSFLLRSLPAEGETLHVQCEGDICLQDWHPQNDPLVKLLGPKVWRHKVLLNLENVSFLDTGGISWLVNCQERFHNAGGLLILHSISSRVSLVLKLLHMEKVLSIAADLSAAQAIAERGKP